MKQYIDNGNGTVTDTKTGLMWQQATSSNMLWDGALQYCEDLTLASHDDLRLPTIQELQSIVDYSRHNPAIDTAYFPGTLPSWYWSSTTYAYDSSYAWCAYFYDGYVSSCGKGNYLDVRAVRGGQQREIK